jgi:hypothetical protein
MTRPSLRRLLSFPSFLFLALAVTSFYRAPAQAQSYCGRNTVVNFVGSNGSNFCDFLR